MRKGWALTIEQRNSSSLLGFLFSETVNCKLSTVDSSSRVPRRTTFRQPVSAALILSRHRPGSPSGSAIRQRTQHRPENRLPVLPAESRPLLRLPRTRDPCRSRSRDRIKCSAPLHCDLWPEVLSLLPCMADPSRSSGHPGWVPGIAHVGSPFFNGNRNPPIFIPTP